MNEYVMYKGQIVKRSKIPQKVETEINTGIVAPKNERKPRSRLVRLIIYFLGMRFVSQVCIDNLL
jgi:hypothetical protein